MADSSSKTTAGSRTDGVSDLNAGLRGDFHSYSSDNSLERAVARGHDVVFFDVTIGETPSGRIKLELFTSVTPRTCENFRQLCTGEFIKDGKSIGYKGAPFHRIIKDFMIQGGDVLKGNGTGSISIYGTKFADEVSGLELKHDSAGMLSMANAGKHSNACQFFITAGKCSWLDGKHVVFGRCLDDESMLVMRMVEAVSADTAGKPSMQVLISECGAL